MSQHLQKIVPHLWFDSAAEQAARRYSQLLPNSGIGHLGRYTEAGRELHGRPPGSVMSAEVTLDGFVMVLINGGPVFRPTPAVSFYLAFEQPDALEQAWQRLLEGGTVMMPLDKYDWSPRYGWLADRYGVSWQLSMGSRDTVHGSPVVPSLLFTGPVAGRAEQAIEHYTSIFPDSSITGILRHDGSGVDTEGSIMHAQFRLAGQTFMAGDSAMEHKFGFSEATSLLVLCESQQEVDHYWEALTAVPEAEACGWLKDRFGVSWQIVPRVLIEGMKDPDTATVQRITEAFMQMKKLDVARLEDARRG